MEYKGWVLKRPYKVTKIDASKIESKSLREKVIESNKNTSQINSEEYLIVHGNAVGKWIDVFGAMCIVIEGDFHGDNMGIIKSWMEIDKTATLHDVKISVDF